MRFLILLLATTYIVGCSICEDAELNGPRDLLVVSKFNQLFEKHSEKIGQHRGIGEGDYWESKGLIYGRYIVTLSFKVRVSKDCSLSKESTSTIRVMEYYSYTEENAGSGKAKGRMIGELTEKQFMALVDASEIFEVIDTVPVKNKPINGLEDVLEFW